jgi:hypothetical protein
MAIIFITFIELVLEGGWNEIPEGDQRIAVGRQGLGTAYRANGPSDLRIVEPEIVIREFQFGTNDVVVVGNGVVSFDSVHIKNELTVDETKRTPDRKRLVLD